MAKKTKKESNNKLLRNIAILGLVFSALVLVITLINYSSFFIQAFQQKNFLFFLKFLFSNNVLFLVLFVLTSIFLMKANNLARIVWIVLSAYFVLPNIYSLVISLYNLQIYSIRGIVFDIFLIVSSVYLMLNKKISKEFNK